MKRPIEILLVENHPGDIRLTREVFSEGQLSNRLHVVEDGVEAMAFLRRAGAFATRPRPDLILLDLNLPRKDGRQVLQEIKLDEQLKVIPVVVLTTSKAEEDILRAYRLHANCYITKPIDLNEFIRVVKSIEGFWLETARLPHGTNGSA